MTDAGDERRAWRTFVVAVSARDGYEQLIEAAITPGSAHRYVTRQTNGSSLAMTSPSTRDTQQAADLRHALATTLAAEGAITSAHWRHAFSMVPRHLFTPRFFLHADNGGYRAVDSADPEWLAAVYSDCTLVTQLDADDSAWHRIRRAGPISGRPSSSSTQPRLMAWMLQALDAQPGMGSGHSRLPAHGAGRGWCTRLSARRAV